jgi:nitric oxide synthase oxygenase domain/subunit
VLKQGFLEGFPDADFAGRSPVINGHDIERLLKEFKRLRLTDETIYLRNAAVNLINGMINMSFSCDGTHYIDHHTFFAKLDRFETTEQSP